MELKWYFRKLMATGSLIPGIDSSQESIPPKLSDTHTLDEKSIPASKLRFHGHWETLFHNLVPTRFLCLMAASKIVPLGKNQSTS